MNEETIFAAALELQSPERAAFLAKACGGDTALRKRLEGLLAASDRAGNFMARPAVESANSPNAATEMVDGKSSPQDATVTSDGPASHSEDESEALAFLTPSKRPDSQGRIGHYEVLQVLGKGGFGIVFRAFDDVLQRVVAVKVMSPQLAATSPARKRFLREARTSAQVRHENVVQVYEVAEQPLPYLAMEFIPGETLQQRLDRIGPVEPAEVVRIGRQIAEGLAAAHACDLIHRDIKPSNVLLEGGQQKAKITDFGLARAADDASISQSGIIAGTPMYMAPEQAKGETLDQRADLFSLGSVLYQMVSGRAPFRANNTVAVLKRVAEDTPRDIREIIPETPQWLCDIIAKLHAKDPEERFQTAREVADVLADCEAQLEANSKLKDFSRIPRGKPRPSGRRKWVAAAVVLLLPAIALAVTEFAGVTHLFRRQATPDPIKPASEPQAEATTGWHGWPADAPKPAIAPFDATQARVHQEAWAKHLGVPVEYTNSIGMKFVLIPPGEFTMGSTEAEVEAALAALDEEDKYWHDNIRSERPQHKVILTQPIYLGMNEVTQAEYEKVMGVNPSYFAPMGIGKDIIAGMDTKRHPVEQVSWNDAAEFCAKLTQQEKLEAFDFRDGENVPKQRDTGYRLPREAEWEFACRAGTTTSFSSGATAGDLQQAAWTGANSGGRTHAVGELKSNPFGLYDIHGNVYEWVEDWWDAGYYGQFQEKTAVNPTGPSAPGSKRVFRGGAFFLRRAYACRASNRHSFDPLHRNSDVGFRVALPVAAVKIAKQQPLPPTYKNSIGMEFVIVPKGKSWLGGGSGVVGEHGVEAVHEVEIAQDFYLGKFEVTQEEWQKVMGKNPSSFFRTGAGKDSVKDLVDADLARFPVDNVSWDDCQEFITRVNEQSKEKGWVYRLPKQSEWEYACRGGPLADRSDSTFDFYCEKPTNYLRPDQANIVGKGRTCKVGSYKPNRLGLHDMHGNVWEWCEDAFDAKDPALASLRAIRGGCWVDGAENCRAAVRHATTPSLRSHYFGLRLARVPSAAPSPEAKTPPLAVAPFTDADVKRIAALPAAEQVEEVRKELVRRNPGFDGKMGHKIEGGVVTELTIVSDKVTDIAPIRFFKALRVLECSGTLTNKSNGLLADLTPLKGMNLANLTFLSLGDTRVGDAGLIHFKDCKALTNLWLHGTQVSDAGLTHFKDCKGLTDLHLERTQVSDAGLTHFKDCENLTFLSLGDTRVGDAGLFHFKDCKDLKGLWLYGTQVSNKGLAYLKDCKGLTDLHLERTQVSDAGLGYLKGMPLRVLWIYRTGITDLTPLQGMPLEEIRLTPKNITKGLDILRDMKSLKTLGIANNQVWPAAEFWERYDKGEFK